MEKICEICGKNYTPKAGTERWSKNCYDCFKAGKVPPTKDKVRHDEIMNALRELYAKVQDVQSAVDHIVKNMK